MRVLITAATKHGATGEVADRIANRFRAAGIDVSVTEPRQVASLDGYDAVLIGSGIYAGSWLRPAAALVDRHAAQLAELPVWAFSCGPVGDPAKPTERPKAADATAAKAGAREHRIFPGVVDRSQLGVAERAVMAVLKVPDGDYRDLAEVDVWADGVAAEVAGRPASA